MPSVESSGGSSSGGGSGSGSSIDTSNFILFNNNYVTDCNLHYINGYAKTNTSTAHLPNLCNGGSSWGILFCLLENVEYGTGTQMFFPIDGGYKGRIFVRSVKNLKKGGATISPWSLLALDSSVSSSNVPIGSPGETNKGGNTNE